MIDEDTFECNAKVVTFIQHGVDSLFWVGNWNTELFFIGW